jgi:hypothetical protein
MQTKQPNADPLKAARKNFLKKALQESAPSLLSAFPFRPKSKTMSAADNHAT